MRLRLAKENVKVVDHDRVRVAACFERLAELSGRRQNLFLFQSLLVELGSVEVSRAIGIALRSSVVIN